MVYLNCNKTNLTQVGFEPKSTYWIDALQTTLVFEPATARCVDRISID